MNCLFRVIICILVSCYCVPVYAMANKAEFDFYLPPIDETALSTMQSVIHDVSPQDIQALKAPAVIDELLASAKEYEATNPLRAIQNYLHAVCLAKKNKSSLNISVQRFLINHVAELAVKVPEKGKDYLCAAFNCGCKNALIGLGQLFYNLHQFDNAELAWRLHVSPKSLCLLGKMHEKCNHELKARAYYLASGYMRKAQSYRLFASMAENRLWSLKQCGCTDEYMLHHYLDDAINGYVVAAGDGDMPSMYSIMHLADSAEGEFNYVVPAQKRMFAYNQLFSLVGQRPDLCESYRRFCEKPIEQLPAPITKDTIHEMQQELNNDTRSIVQEQHDLCAHVAQKDLSAKYQYANALFWSVNRNPEMLLEIVKLYTEVLTDLDDEEIKQTICERLKRIVDEGSSIDGSVELFFWILSHSTSQLLEYFFGYNLAFEYKYNNSILEYIDQHCYDRLQEYMQTGCPLALYIGGIICNHRAALLPEMSSEQRLLLHQARKLLEKACQEKVVVAKSLLMDISCKLAKFYREAGDYERAYALMVPIWHIGAGPATVNSMFLQEYALLGLERPDYLNVVGATHSLIKALDAMPDDYRAACCSLYLNCVDNHNSPILWRCVYEFICSIVNNDEKRKYFFEKCPVPVRQALQQACVAHNPHASFVYCLLIFLNNEEDSAVGEYITQCIDAQNPWTKCMKSAFAIQYPNHEYAHEQAVSTYCELLSCPIQYIKDYVYGALQKFAQHGDVASCCEIFLAACQRNDTPVAEAMFALIKNNVVKSSNAIKYLSDHAYERLLQVAGNTVYGTYLLALVQGYMADVRKARNADWDELANDALYNFIRAHKNGYPCEKKIALLGCCLVDYCKQVGNGDRAQKINDDIHAVCSAEILSAVVIDCLQHKKNTAASVANMRAQLDELACAGDCAALEFMGRAYNGDPQITLGAALPIDTHKALQYLSALLEKKPNDYQLCYVVGKLLTEQHSGEQEESIYKRACSQLQRAVDAGIQGADRFTLIYKLNSNQLNSMEREQVRSQLGIYASAGDEEIKQLLVQEQKNYIEQRRDCLKELIQSSQSTTEQVQLAVEQLEEFAKYDAASQWFLIEFYMQHQKLPSGSVYPQSDIKAYHLLTEYLKTQQPTIQAYSHMIRLLVDMAETPMDNNNFSRAYELVQRVQRFSHVRLDCDECYAFAYACYKTSHFKEALEWISTVQGFRNVCWFRALCYLRDESIGQERFVPMLNELTRALTFDDSGKVPAIDSFIDSEFIIKKLEELASPRAIALLSRITYFMKGQIPSPAMFHSLQEAAENDKSAQSFLGHLYRHGIGVPKSFESAVDILFRASPELDNEPVELDDEIAEQTGSLVGVYLAKKNSFLSPGPKKKLLRLLYTMLPGLIEVNMILAMNYYDDAEQMVLDDFVDDDEAIGFNRTCGAYDLIMQLALKQDVLAISTLVSCECARYLRSLQRLSEIKEQGLTCCEGLGTPTYNLYQKNEVLRVLRLLDQIMHEKKLLKEYACIKDKAIVLASAFDFAGRVSFRMEEPAERIIAYFRQALSLTPNDWHIIHDLAHALVAKANSRTMIQEGITLLENAGEQGDDEAWVELGQLFAPGYTVVNKLLEKDSTRALRYLVRAYTHSATATMLLGEACPFALAVNPLRVEGKGNQAEMTCMYKQAEVAFRGYNFDGALELFKKLAARHMVAASVKSAELLYYWKNDCKKASEMLFLAIKDSHGLLPMGSSADSFDDLVQKFALSPDPVVRGYASQVREALIKERIRSCNKYW